MISWNDCMPSFPVKPRALSQELKSGDRRLGQNFPARLLRFSQMWLSIALNMDILVLTFPWRIKETSSRWRVIFNWVLVYAASFVARRKERERETGRQYCWTIFPHVSCVSARLVSRATEWLCFGLSFRWCLDTNSLGRQKQGLPLEQSWQVKGPYKKLGSCKHTCSPENKEWHRGANVCVFGIRIAVCGA